MSLLRTTRQYLYHRIRSANPKGHGVHSPFFFDFIQQVLPDTGHLPEFEKPERYRQELLRDDTIFPRTDLGSGGRKPVQSVSVRSIAQRALQPPRGARLLYRILKHYSPGLVLELGTCFGVTTQYLVAAQPAQPIYTLEGDPFIAQKARARFQEDGFAHIESIIGNFDELLSDVLRKIGPVGFVWLDGNHRKEPTLRYFEELLPYLSDDSILVFDDIYWSAEMQEAWRSIQQHPRVRATIDLFWFGIVLFRKEFREPVHLRLHY